MLAKGTAVEILEAGKWVGPFIVTGMVGRTPDHLVLANNGSQFEHYYDGPFNTRECFTAESALREALAAVSVAGEVLDNSGMEYIPIERDIIDTLAALGFKIVRK